MLPFLFFSFVPKLSVEPFFDPFVPVTVTTPGLVVCLSWRIVYTVPCRYDYQALSSRSFRHEDVINHSVALFEAPVPRRAAFARGPADSFGAVEGRSPALQGPGQSMLFRIILGFTSDPAWSPIPLVRWRHDLGTARIVNTPLCTEFPDSTM